MINTRSERLQARNILFVGIVVICIYMIVLGHSAVLDLILSNNYSIWLTETILLFPFQMFWCIYIASQDGVVLRKNDYPPLFTV